jgi:Fis family transcriptional regulator, factor for inversion stimulation protein
MSKQDIYDVVTSSLQGYFRDLGTVEPTNVYAMMIDALEKPMLEVVMARANNNQSKAAQWLGLNRNTLRKKLQSHKLIT